MFAYTSPNMLSTFLTLALCYQSSLSMPTSSKSTSNDPTPSNSASSQLPNLSPLSNAHPISGPVETSIFADPSIIKVGDTYYAYATNTKEYIVPIATSPDFENWTVLQKSALPKVGAWAATGVNQSVWAPDVIQASPGHFVMYYTAVVADAIETKRCIGTATSTDPEGPFQPGDKPIVCPTNANVIDPAGFIHNDGSHYIVHKLVTSLTSIVLQPMTSDGLTPVGGATTLVEADEAESWNTEAPSLVYAGGSFVLFFSTGFWAATTYTVSVATAKDIKGPYTKLSAPLLATGSIEEDLVAPGGADVMFVEDIVDDAKGGQTVHIVFHAAESRTQLGTRHLWTGQVNIDGADVSV